MVTIKEGTPAQAWQKFIKKSIESRLEVEKFERFAQQLSTKVSVSPFEIASIIISSETFPTSELSVDPRYLRYIQCLVSANLVSLADVLDALLRAQGKPNETTAKDGSSPPSREPVETAILISLATLAPTLKIGPSTVEEVNFLMNVLGRWMDAVIAAGDGDGLNMLDGAVLEGLELGGSTMAKAKKDAMGELVAAIGENDVLGGWMKGGMAKDKRMLFDTNLPMFANVFRTSNPQLSSRLDALKRPQTSDEMGHKGMEGMMQGLNVDLGGMGSGVQGLGGMNMPGGQICRAGLYIFFNALFVGRPLVDDEYILNYLHNRYKDDLQTMMMDFVVAVLDCLSNAISRSESRSMISLIRHFFVNKVPQMLSRFHLPTMTTQFILTNALMKSDSTILSLDPSMGGGSADAMMVDYSNDVKQEFLFACALHGVIEESSIQEILGEVPLQTMASKKYTQADLLNECLQDPERVERLLTEMEEMDGNSGAVVGAIVEVIRHMSYQKETMSLRNICNTLTRSPKLLDLILLYVKPSYILEPLCELLDTWRYEEDQGEYQPVYEEFGYILLLVLAICYRYDLTLQDLGDVPHERFIPQLLTNGTHDPLIETLKESKEKYAQLGGWISALYGGDGVGDELLQSCRPQDFFMLVPAIFSQSVEACDRSVIDLETLNAELEYLHLPFLIASQVGAISWLTNYLWQSHANVQSPLKLLHALIFPESALASDVQQTHRTIIAMCARNLDRVLRDLIRQPQQLEQSQQHMAEQIIQEISQHLSYKRAGHASQSELDSWTGLNAGGGFIASLKASVGSLVMWATAPDINMTPASYTHRLLLTAWRTLGARVVVRALVDELVAANQTNDASAAVPAGDLTLDVVAAMICAPTVEDFGVRVHEVSTGAKQPGSNVTSSETGGRMTLADALRSLEEDAKMTMEDPGRGEIIMRLARRVEMQMNVGGAAGKFSGDGPPPAGDGGNAGVGAGVGAGGEGDLTGGMDVGGGDGMGGMGGDEMGVLGVDLSDLTGTGLDVGLGDDIMGGM